MHSACVPGPSANSSHVTYYTHFLLGSAGSAAVSALFPLCTCALAGTWSVALLMLTQHCSAIAIAQLCKFKPHPILLAHILNYFAQ
jgi:hypothetical protein